MPGTALKLNGTVAAAEKSQATILPAVRPAHATVVLVNGPKMAPSTSTLFEFVIEPATAPAVATSKKYHDSLGVDPKHPTLPGTEPTAVPPVVFAGKGGVVPQI